MVNVERLRRTFLDLVHLNSPPGQEREVARYCSETLRDAGFICQRDAAGNIIAQKAGTVAWAPRIFFSGHTDTVAPTEGLVVREEEAVFRTSGTTILGADDKAALAEIIEGVQLLEEQGHPHGDLQVILTTGEEVGLLGARTLAPEAIAGSIGFVLDASGPTGSIISAAPTHDSLEVEITGRAAHAGLVPEQGINALQVAARAIDRMHLGRIDPETTANVGTLHGGTATNVVAEQARVTLEARSRNRARLAAQVAQMRACFEEAAAAFGATLNMRHRRAYEGYAWDEAAFPIRLAAEAWLRTRASGGSAAPFRPTGGGSDASIFNARGIGTVVLTCGYEHAHTVRECVALADLVAGAEWVMEIARTASSGELPEAVQTLPAPGG
jgi:tripeptide aminopeptidase